MKLYKIFMVFFLFALAHTFFAKTVYISDKKFSAEISYADFLTPGDPLVIYLTLKNRPTYKIKFENSMFNGNASIFSISNGKKLASNDFYLYDQTKNQSVYIALIPLSSFFTQKEYHIQFEGNITFNIKASKKTHKDFFAKETIQLKKKEFISETIHLDAQNTTIRTDASPARAKQIERLNEVLKIVDNDSLLYLSDGQGFIKPIETNRKTSFFADRRVFAYSDGRSSTSLHYGIDFGAPKGTPVFSTAKGKVVLAEDRVTTGYSLAIEHFPGLYSLYYHLDEYIVAEGDMVDQGQQIGMVGSTGLSTGPHLHWEMRLRMEAINPEWFIENNLFQKRE
ncbi:MAG: M23 family metallopeptidase [Treponemataceae bacterium]